MVWNKELLYNCALECVIRKVHEEQGKLKLGGTLNLLVYAIFRHVQKLRKAIIILVISVCPSVCPHGITRRPLGGFSLNCVFEYFSDIFIVFFSINTNNWLTNKISVTLTPSMHSQTRHESRYKKTHPNSVSFCTAHNTHTHTHTQLQLSTSSLMMVVDRNM
jgi:hypothetical protein